MPFLNLPVRRDKTSGFALSQVTVLAELRCDFLHADSIGNEWRGDRMRRGDPQEIHIRPAVVLQLRYLIPFIKREDFESAWPHLLKVKSKGAPLILMRGGKTDFFEVKPALDLAYQIQQ